MKLHRELPIPKEYLKYIVADVLYLYPEADSVSVVGTYARLKEKPSKSHFGHDLDISIHFPGAVNRRAIEHRNDDWIWAKWNEKTFGVTIDFLLAFGKEVPKYGKHLWRLENKMKTPKVMLWRKR
jgi:hypothetical protein